MSTLRERMKSLIEGLKSKKRVRIMAIYLALTVLCFAVCSIHIVKITQLCSGLIFEGLREQTMLGSEVIGESFDKNCNLIESEAYEMANSEEISYLSIMQSLDSLGRRSNSSDLYYYDHEGCVYCSNRATFGGSLEEFESLINRMDRTLVYLNEKSYHFKDIGNHSYTIASPVRKKGMPVGIVMGVFDTNKLFSYLSLEGESSIADCYIVDKEGRVIASYERLSEQRDLFKKSFFEVIGSEAVSVTEAERLESSLRNGFSVNEAGDTAFSIKGGKKYIFYAPIPNVMDWKLVFAVSQGTIVKYMNRFIMEVVAFVILLVLLIGATTGLVVRFEKEGQKEIEQIAYLDSLTMIPNTAGFTKEATAMLKENQHTPYRIVSFDIMNFRYINDAYGHMKADMLLKSLADACRSCFGENEVYGRDSADKFIALVQDDVKTWKKRAALEARLRQAASALYINYPIRIKSGSYHIVDHNEDVKAMIDKANLARKSVFEDAKERDVDYRETLLEETRHFQYIESKMYEALDRGEFEPFLQPKWDMKNNEICGAEALVRWRKSDGSIIPPGDFIPVFEKNGFIEKIDFFMLEEICKYLRKMLDENREVFPVSINQSRYLLYNPDYVNKVHQILMKYNIPKGLLELELTETVFFQERDRMIEVMKQLKEMNVSLSIDDFGSGYSSLNLLRDMPFDVMKIDRGFLDKTCTSESGKWILKKIVEMAEGLDFKVICEGVETMQQVEMLLGINCIYAQGFYYSKPISMDEFISKYNVKHD